MRRENTNQDKGLIIILFFIWPLAAMFHAFKNYKRAYSKNILCFFTAFFGLTFIVHEDSGDIKYYAEQLKVIGENISFSNLQNQLLVADGYIDVYQPLLTFLVSLFTTNPKILFAAFGLVLGYFFSRNVWILLSKAQSKIRFSGILLLVVFCFIVHIGSGINGVRMWTGAHIFVFGVLSYFLENKKKNIIWSFLSIFVHFSYLLPFIILITYIILPKKKSIIPIYVFFVLSFFVSELNFDLGRDAVSNLPVIYQERAGKYVSEAVENQIITYGQRERHWSVSLSRNSLKALIFIIGTYLFLLRTKLLTNKSYITVFAYALLLFGVTNLFNSIPSIGRYLSIASLILIALFTIIYFENPSKKFDTFIQLLTPLFIGFMLFQIRVFLTYPNTWLLFGNPLIALLVENQSSVYSILFK